MSSPAAAAALPPPEWVAERAELKERIAQLEQRNRLLRGVLPTPRETRTMLPIVCISEGNEPWQPANGGRGAAARSGRV